MKARTTISVIVAVIFSVACKAPYEPSMTDVLLQHTDVCLVVGRQDMIDFTLSRGRFQYEYNPTLHQFRAGVTVMAEMKDTGEWIETMSDYFVLTLSDNPVSIGQKGLTGTLILRSSTLSRRYPSGTKDTLNLSVLKIDGGKAWLWDDKLKLGVVVRIPAGR